MTCDEIAQTELKRLHDIQVLLETLVFIFGGAEFLNTIALDEPLPIFTT